MARLIDAEKVCKEIARFKDYLDEDMICRLKIAVKRLPTVDAVPVEFIMRWLAKRNSGRTNGKVFSTELVKNLIEDWRKENADDSD